MDLLLFQNTLFALFLATLLAITISKLRAKKLKLPPGPICFPIFGNWLQVGNHLNHRNLADLSQKYGDLFLLRMGQRNLVNVCSPDLAKEVLQTQGIEFGSRTRNVVFDIFTGKGQDMIFTVYGEHWRKMRRIMTVPFFTNKVVHHYKQAWEEEATFLVDDLLKNPEASTVGIGIRRRLQLLMHNNVYRIMFSRRFEREDDPLFLKLYKVNEDRGRLAQSLEYNYGDFIPILRPFIRRYLNLCQQVCDARMQLFDYFVKQRKKEQTNTSHGDGELRCGIDHILEAQQKGEINDGNVLYAIENMNIAGIDTISRSIEWCIADLVNNPRVQKKLQDELDTVVGHGIQITEADLKNLPYLEAVIKETLRLRMAAPLLVPHMNLKDEKLGGYDIPAESRVSINGWWLANNPAHWKKPEEFRPERFLEEEINVEVHGNEFKYIPFGVGRRSCPGMVLAIPIFGITLGTLVKNFEMLAPLGEDKIDTTERAGQFSLHIVKPYNVVFKPRSF